jgi:Xaa-Pro aminopeptidase
MMLFSRDEYVQRVDRARALMRAQGIDAILATAPNNLVYLSGYRTNLFDSNFRPFQVLVPANGDPVLILPTLEVGVGEEVSWIEDIRPWGPPPGSIAWAGSPPVIAADAVSAAKIVIEEKKLSSSKIAIEQGFGQRLGMSIEQFLQLKAALPQVTWVDATQLTWKLRGIKSPKEVEYLREANRITDCGYYAVLEAARVGMTERELQGVMGEAFMHEGSDFKGFIIVQSGESRYKMMNPYASDRKVERGDMITFDFGAVYNGYWSDLTRSFFIGSASARQREMYEAAREVSQLTVESMRPGMTCGEVDEVAEKALHERGFKENMLHRTGHSIGLEVHEMPSIARGDPAPLEPGVTVAIEPGIYDFNGVGGFRVEDIVLMTDRGAEYLSHCRRELTII